METVLMAAGVFGLVFLALAIGVIFKRNCIRGSCQGSIQAGDGSGCRCGKYDFDKKPVDSKHSSLKPL
ncbi:hypothetical protein [Maridesulfovibrio sp.]|jgi:hypothetical protein|uniref:hypothetical protein n=1 Tax=Maridesulfovibrio sp. TaxID=2795000 RepID=UPI0029CA0A90|nr:hypothetical protein [Maridesulfovibrio sp.]